MGGWRRSTKKGGRKSEKVEGGDRKYKRWPGRMVKRPRNVPVVVHHRVPCSPSGEPPEPLPDFTSIYKHFGRPEIE